MKGMPYYQKSWCCFGLKRQVEVFMTCSWTKEDEWNTERNRGREVKRKRGIWITRWWSGRSERELTFNYSESSAMFAFRHGESLLLTMNGWILLKQLHTRILFYSRIQPKKSNISPSLVPLPLSFVSIQVGWGWSKDGEEGGFFSFHSFLLHSFFGIPVLRSHVVGVEYIRDRIVRKMVSKEIERGWRSLRPSTLKSCSSFVYYALTGFALLLACFLHNTRYC